MKQYRLKKPLPYRTAGETLTWDETHKLYCYDIVLPNDELNSWYTKEYVESNPDWFEKVEPKHKLLELLEAEYEKRSKNPSYTKEQMDGFDWAISYVRNYLQSEPLFCEGVKGKDEPYYVIFTEEETKKRAGLYSILRFQANKIQPNAGDSYYVELGKLLDKHLREEK